MTPDDVQLSYFLTGLGVGFIAGFLVGFLSLPFFEWLNDRKS